LERGHVPTHLANTEQAAPEPVASERAEGCQRATAGHTVDDELLVPLEAANSLPSLRAKNAVDRTGVRPVQA
jgi:hypothetical protein